ncbi:MAG: bifunctional DNA-formamidopyrimidine glycosylase/DNA-(apurinic or apyrimidinic site) lyase, partial [Vicinamibacterales bacterium]
MPELPEVETVARTLNPVLRGRVIAGFQLLWHRTLERPSLTAFIESVLGRSIDSVGRRGKLIVVRLSDGGSITIHLRMTGELLFRADHRLARPIERESHLRARFEFADDSELVFYDTRKFGKITHLSAGELSEFDASLGAEPLAETFSAELLRTILEGRQRQIKALLLDQSVIVGLGNIYVDEALHRARIHPLHRSSKIDAERSNALHSAIVDILSTAISLQGTTLRDYRTGLGEPGENQDRLRIYGRKATTPCPDCGTPLERIVVGQRSTIYCPSCQPLTT